MEIYRKALASLSLKVVPVSDNFINLSKLKDIPEEAEKELNTKQELTDRIRSLQREILQLKGQGKQPVQTDSKLVMELQQDIQLLHNQLKQKDRQITDAARQYAVLEKNFQQLQKTAIDVLQKGILSIQKVQPPENDKQAPAPVIKPQPANSNFPAPPPQRSAPAKPPKVTPAKTSAAAHAPASDRALAKAEKAILAGLALYPDQWVTRSKAAFMAHISPTTGHYRNTLGSLRGNGYIEENGMNLKITDAGLTALGSFEPLPTDPDEIINHWANKLGKLPGAMLKVLQGYYPQPITREKLAQETNVQATTGHFRNCLGDIRIMGLIEEGRNDEGQTVKLSDELF